MANRRLVLRRECLAELTAQELTDVVAGAVHTHNCPDDTYYCITGPAICRETRILCV